MAISSGPIFIVPVTPMERQHLHLHGHGRWSHSRIN